MLPNLNIGKAIITTTSFVTVVLFLLSKYYHPTQFGWTTLAQFSGIAGLFCLCWAFLLSIRHRSVEKLFSGLDKVYRVHHLLGGIAYLFIINHPLFLILNRLPQNTLNLYLFPNDTVSYTIGILAFYLITLLVILTLFVNLPYKLWKKTHEWMGWVIILGGLHSLLVVSDISRFAPLRYWMFFWIVAAVGSVIYKRFLYYLLQKPNNFTIINSQTKDGIIYLKLKLKSGHRKIDFLPGQFAFLSLNSRHENPFTVLSQDGDQVDFAIKIYGDFTNQLSEVPVGSSVTLRGPYGHFAISPNTSPQVWVAGGIGITPFVSMLGQIMQGQSVTLIWSCGDNALDPLVNIFKKFQSHHHNFHFIHIDTSIHKHISAATLKQKDLVGSGFRYYICGPLQMMTSLTSQLVDLGIKKRKIIYEDFSFK